MEDTCPGLEGDLDLEGVNIIVKYNWEPRPRQDKVNFRS